MIYTKFNNKFNNKFNIKFNIKFNNKLYFDILDSNNIILEIVLKNE